MENVPIQLHGHIHAYQTMNNNLKIDICEDRNMENGKVFHMKFSKVYPLLIAKAERKGRKKEEVDMITQWLTGYSCEQLDTLLTSDITYRSFFEDAPMMNPSRKLIKGSICGVKVEEIQDTLMQEIRYLDKLVDELAKGKAMDKILRK